MTLKTANRDDEDAATGAVTIGQALRAVALSPAGDRPVDHADAAAVQAAVESATGQGGGVIVPGSVAAVAQRAAETNTTPPEETRGGEEAEKQMTLRDVLGDRAATFVDAEKVTAASSGREGGGCADERGAIDVMLHCRDANNYP
jgi:hypothetical protein